MKIVILGGCAQAPERSVQTRICQNSATLPTVFCIIKEGNFIQKIFALWREGICPDTLSDQRLEFLMLIPS
jgi:hypothetical protein